MRRRQTRRQAKLAAVDKIVAVLDGLDKHDAIGSADKTQVVRMALSINKGCISTESEVRAMKEIMGLL
jgi:hypothetical protein